MNLHHEFKRNGHDQRLVADLQQKISNEHVDKMVETLVEQMVEADLRATPQLFSALTTDHEIDRSKVSRLFGARMTAEIDHGLAGKPIDDFFRHNTTEFHGWVDSMLTSEPLNRQSQ